MIKQVDNIERDNKFVDEINRRRVVPCQKKFYKINFTT